MALKCVIMKVFSKRQSVNQHHHFVVSVSDCEMFQSTWLPCLNRLNETPVSPRICFCGCICLRVQHWPTVSTQCWRDPNYILYPSLGCNQAALKARSSLKLNMMNIRAFLWFNQCTVSNATTQCVLNWLCAYAGQYSQPLVIIMCSCAVTISDRASSC